MDCSTINLEKLPSKFCINNSENKKCQLNELISSRNLFFKGESLPESLSNFTSVRRPTYRRRCSTTKIDEDGDTGIELVATKVRLLQ